MKEVTTSDRLLNVLGLFSLERPEWTVEDAAQQLGLAVSTAYRYFRSLSKAGLIASFATGRYVLGPAIIAFDRQIRLRDPLIITAKPIVNRLTAQLSPKALVLLCRLFRNQVMFVHSQGGERAHFATTYDRGRSMPLLRGAASKIILAHLSQRTAKALYTKLSAEFKRAGIGATWTDAREYLRILREGQVSITHAEVDPGLSGLAVAVFDHDGTIIGSLGVVMEARALSPKIIADAKKKLLTASKQITKALAVVASRPGDHL